MGRNKKTLIGLGVVLASVALAQNVQKTLTLMINGNKSATSAIVVDGKNYVSVDALKTAGATASLNGSTLSLTLPKVSVANTQKTTGQAQGGANQLNSVEGCINELLFNGVLRLRVNKIEPYKKDGDQGYRITFEVRNGTTTNFLLDNTGLVYKYDTDTELRNISFVLSDGSVLQPDRQYSAYYDQFHNKALPPGASLVLRLNFFFPDSLTDQEKAELKPNKLLIQFDKNQLAKNDDTKKLSFTVKDPSFRVNFNCSK